MKLHLPLSLRSALLACLTVCPVAHASTYVSTGVNADNVAASNRLYDHGQGVYWTEAGAQPFIGAGLLYEQTGSTEFLGNLNNYIPAGTDTSHVHSGLFAGLTTDDKTSWISATANVIQYWQSYYGVFSQKAGEMPYGYTYNPAYQPTLGGTQSTNVGMYFYDNWTNAGGDFAMAARWYLTNDHTFTGLGDKGVSELKNPNAAAGYFTPYFSGHESSVVVTDPASQEALDAAVIKAFGLEATEEENVYKQSKPGQIAFLGVSCGENSDALTCYGFETDSNGNVKSLLLASSSDAAYGLTKLYVKAGKEGDRLRLYTDSACTNLWQHGGEGAEGGWYLDALSYIETPEVLVNMYKEYSESTLTWTGATTTWKQETDDKSLYTLPDATSGWTAHAGIATDFAGDYAAYYTEGRNVLFTSIGTGVIELVGDIEPSLVTVNNDLGADYTFTGEGKLTGITRLTKLGEGTLTISTANDYSGGTYLEEGMLIAGNKLAFGVGDIRISGGILDFGGMTLSHNIQIESAGEVELRNGTTNGNLVYRGEGIIQLSNYGVSGNIFNLEGVGDSRAVISAVSSDESAEKYIISTAMINMGGLSELTITGEQTEISASEQLTIANNGNVLIREAGVYGKSVSIQGNGIVEMSGVEGEYVEVIGNEVVRMNDGVDGVRAATRMAGWDKVATLVMMNNGLLEAIGNEGSGISGLVELSGNDIVRVQENRNGINASRYWITGNARVEIRDNEEYGIGGHGPGGPNQKASELSENGYVLISGNREGMYVTSLLQICGNEYVEISGNECAMWLEGSSYSAVELTGNKEIKVVETGVAWEATEALF